MGWGGVGLVVVEQARLSDKMYEFPLDTVY